MESAAKRWYAGLNCVYEDLYQYLKNEKQYSELVWSSWLKWKERQGKGYPLKFKAKIV
jgi:hypothetical protein